MSRALILIEVVEQNFNPYLGHDPNSPPGLHGRKKNVLKLISQFCMKMHIPQTDSNLSYKINSYSSVKYLHYILLVYYIY
jgi:hypothetical protein